MLLRLGAVDVLLQSESALIRAYWQKAFANTPQETDDGVAADRLRLNLDLAPSVSAPRDATLLYRDPQGIVDVFHDSRGWFTLHFDQGASVRLAPDKHPEVWGTVTPAIFEHGRLEDVIYTALAPLLRRRGRFLLHAAAVSTGSGALLLVGPTHSGKTTTALALVLAGWKHLASDVVVLFKSERGVLAYPTAGVLAARAPSFELLPALRDLLANEPQDQPVIKNGRLLLAPEQWGKPLPVVAICFPRVSAAEHSSLQPLEASLALARLLEESVDRWDANAMLDHIEFLTTLSQQARQYQLTLAPDVERLPQLLKNAL